MPKQSVVTKQVLRILTYHRVAHLADTPTVDVRSVSATPENFLLQMAHVASRYNAVSASQVLDAIERKAALPKRAVLITFDDGYADFTEFAWPILKRLHLPATIFVPTAYPDHPERPFWWDKLYQAFAKTSRKELSIAPLGTLPLGTPEQKRNSLRLLQDYALSLPAEATEDAVNFACERLTGRADFGAGSTLGWEQLRKMAREGVTVGSHTRTHPILTKLTAEQIRDEVRSSQADLKREIGYALPILCYPNGDHDQTVTNTLREEGIVLGFTTRCGGNNLNSADLLTLRRTDITPRTSFAIFELRMLRMGTYLDAWRCRRKRQASARRLPTDLTAVGSPGQPKWAV